jgi:hypothetical protein
MADRLADVVRRLALRPGGFRTTDAELEPFGEPSQIGRNMSYLVRSGAIISVRLTARSAIYFGRREWADAWILSANHAPWERRLIKGSGAELQHREPLRGEVVLAADVKITQCPGYVPRFQPVVVPGAPRVYHGAVGRVQ